jgi:hypothetical protein
MSHHLSHEEDHHHHLHLDHHGDHLEHHHHHHHTALVADPLASLHYAQDVVDATVGGVLGEDEEESALRAGEEAAAAAMEGGYSLLQGWRLYKFKCYFLLWRDSDLSSLICGLFAVW